MVTGAHLAVRRVADRPQATWTSADLRVVSGVGYLPGRSPAVRPLYDLLIACLEHRVGDDVRIGPDAARIGNDEIGLPHREPGGERR